MTLIISIFLSSLSMNFDLEPKNLLMPHTGIFKVEEKKKDKKIPVKSEQQERKPLVEASVFFLEPFIEGHIHKNQ